MKSCIFLIILLITQISFGQDLIKSADKVDDFTGERVLNTNVVAVANGVSIGNLKFCLGRYVTKDNDMYALNIISSKDLGCSGSNSNYIHFLFTDGTSVKYDKDQAKVDCNDINISIYVVDKNDFVNKVISKVRFAKSSDYADYTWTSLVSLDAFFDILK
jgi:hypothetical protein